MKPSDDEKILVIIGEEKRFPSKSVKLIYKIYTNIKNNIWIIPFIEKIWRVKKDKTVFFVLSPTIQNILIKKGIPFKNSIDLETKNLFHKEIIHTVFQWYKDNDALQSLMSYRDVNIGSVLELELMNIFQRDMERFELIKGIIEDVKPTKIFVDEYSIKKFVENISLETKIATICPKSISKIVSSITLPKRHFFNLNKATNYTNKKDIFDEKKKKVLVVTGGFTPIVTLIPVIKEIKRDNKVQIVVLVVRTEKPIEGEKKFTINDIPYKTLGDYTNIRRWENNWRKISFNRFCYKKVRESIEKGSLLEILPFYKWQERKLSLYLSRRILEIRDYLEILEDEIFKREKPDFVLVVNDRCWSHRTTIELGKARQIPTLGIQDSISADIPQCHIISADKLAIFGNYMKEILLKKGLPEDRLVITGDPRYDFITQIPDKFKRDEVYQQLNIDIQKRIIVFAAQFHGFKDEENAKLLRGLYHAIKQLPEIQLVVKLHPFDEHEIADKIAQEMSVNNMIIIKDIDLYKLLNACEILMTVHSTVALEAMLLGKPVIIVNLTNKPDMVPYAKEGAALRVETQEDILPQIKAVLKDSNKVRTQMALNQKKFISRYAYNIDGNASKRIVDLIYSMMSESYKK